LFEKNERCSIAVYCNSMTDQHKQLILKNRRLNLWFFSNKSFLLSKMITWLTVQIIRKTKWCCWRMIRKNIVHALCN